MVDHSVLHVRRAAIEDVRHLVEMRADLQAHMQASNPNLFGLTADWRARKAEFYGACLDDPNRCVLVGCVADLSVIGMGMASIRNEPDLEPSTFGHIDDVWVMPQHRRQGHGRRILAQLLMFFRERGIDDLTVSYVVGNTEAEAFWSKLGFRPALVTATSEQQETDSILSAMNAG